MAVTSRSSDLGVEVLGEMVISALGGAESGGNSVISKSVSISALGGAESGGVSILSGNPIDSDEEEGVRWYEKRWYESRWYSERWYNQ